ncbi:hypothetical protein [Streptosporangium longisporum]|uniref:SAV-6107-like HEPN domain-containing protein n=1 Tax=Streptosporangium longisporum TaxID=46187 RepID=A0ABP6LG55_9ACTN
MNTTTADLTPEAIAERRTRSEIRAGRDSLRAAVLDAASALVPRANRGNADEVLAAAAPLIAWGLKATTPRDLMLRKNAITRHHTNVVAGGTSGRVSGRMDPVPTPEQFLDGCRALYAFLAGDEEG